MGKEDAGVGEGITIFVIVGEVTAGWISIAKKSALIQSDLVYNGDDVILKDAMLIQSRAQSTRKP